MSALATADGGRVGFAAYGPWSDPDRRAVWAGRTLAAVVFVLLVDVLWTIVGIATIGGLAPVPGPTWFDDFDRVTQVVAVLYLATLLAAAAAFIRWQRGAIRNLLHLGCERPEYGPTIAAFGWFIPLVSLVLPLLSLREIARWSRPQGALSAGALLGWWWGGWLISGFVASAATVAFQVFETATGWIVAAAIDIAASLGLIAAAVLAIKVVRNLTDWQPRARAARAGAPAPTAVAQWQGQWQEQ
ncbi:MAG TPA: DUF4328 domain-containing protein [Candidatus Sulfomarinibacteraceae bacterium]|nr:DUF4328 domain-containing protein [Candidatus Sulfomarinibacteraceae bacterium]